MPTSLNANLSEAKVLTPVHFDFRLAIAITKEKSDEIIDDSVVSIAKKGERRMHFSLMVVMVLTWTGIGAIVGIQLEPIFATIGLISFIYGFYLGERWIKLLDMRILE